MSDNPDYLLGELELATYWEVRITNIVITSVILIVLCAIHGHRTLADYRLKKLLGDDVSKNFKRISLCSIGSIVFYTLSMIINIFKSWTTTVTENEYDCHIIYALGSITYYTGKLLMYWVFLLRIKISYANSVYAYNPRTIWSLAAFSFIYIYANFIAGQILKEYVGFSLAYFGLPDAALCIPIYPDQSYDYISTLWIICEFSMSVICVLLFIIPLYKLLKLNATNAPQNGTDYVIAQAAYKATILTTAAVLSSCSMYIIIKWIDTYFGALIYPIDSVINVLSLMLMTKYYDESKYFTFNKVCFCCNYNVLFKCCKVDILQNTKTIISRSNSSASISNAPKGTDLVPTYTSSMASTNSVTSTNVTVQMTGNMQSKN
eukprot:480664_1